MRPWSVFCSPRFIPLSGRARSSGILASTALVGGYPRRARRNCVSDGRIIRPTLSVARVSRSRHLLDRLPEAEGAVGDRELGSHRKPPPFEVEEELFPRL